MNGTAKSIGQRLIELLEEHGVDTVFGIPGVHTVELYRGLADANINHITPRHEQGAGFMADGYARVTGKAGVCFVITGPGLTNIATAMGQALADSIPMLVISTVNPKGTENMGCLHAVPHQQDIIKPLSVATFALQTDDDEDSTMGQIFARLDSASQAKLGPVHLQIPLDVMAQTWQPSKTTPKTQTTWQTSANLTAAADLLNHHQQVVILAGGGALAAPTQVQQLALKLDAPVVTTINARGLMSGHPLSVPASPSLSAVRNLLADAGCVIALGTEIGQTDYDMNVDGAFPALQNLIRIDIDNSLGNTSGQLFIHGDCNQSAQQLLPLVGQKDTIKSTGAARAHRCRRQVWAQLPTNYQQQHRFLQNILDALPTVVMVGDSTQPVYAGNCYFEGSAPRTWFNSATGFGTLGYAVLAAVGAALGLQDQHQNRPVVALTGDGGLQFCLAELATAKDTGLAIIFIVWNNQGYAEIETSMKAVNVTPVGVSPKPPQLHALAQAYGLPYHRCANPADLKHQLQESARGDSPVIIEVDESEIMPML